MMKLSKSDIRDIRARYASGLFTQQELADWYWCAVSTIHRIVSNQTHKDSPPRVGDGTSEPIAIRTGARD